MAGRAQVGRYPLAAHVAVEIGEDMLCEIGEARAAVAGIAGALDRLDELEHASLQAMVEAEDHVDRAKIELSNAQTGLASAVRSHEGVTTLAAAMRAVLSRRSAHLDHEAIHVAQLLGRVDFQHLHQDLIAAVQAKQAEAAVVGPVLIDLDVAR